MKPLTSEWVAKAEGDFHSAVRELRARKDPNYDSSCFHAQQCVEKYLKAFLQEEAIKFSKTHNLTNLLTLAHPARPSLSLLQPQMTALNIYSVDIRYPGETADKAAAKSAVASCREARRVIRTALGLPAK